MPFHSHHYNAHANSPASGIYQAAATLGSIGAPAGGLRVATSGTTSAGTDALLPGSGNAPGLNSSHNTLPSLRGGQTALPAASGLPGPDSLQSTGASYDQQSFETPRRTDTLGRNPEELHISPAAMGQHGSSQASQHHNQQYTSPDQYSGSAPNINLQQATPQGSQYNTASSSNIPGSLQPATTQRPAPSSAYTAPTTVPTMPQISTNAQQYTLPTRSNTMNTSHSSHTYSRSSPAGLEQKYIPFSNTPDPKYSGTPSQKYYNAPTPSGAASNSPLGLADIRPRANSSMQDEPMGSNFYNDNDRTPGNSKYLGSWPVYAFDWCKWPVHGNNSAGKMAVGSYLEDTHNFVRLDQTNRPSCLFMLTIAS
jgi:WD repeat-containing protein 68